jgi:hypothetical protein
VRTPLFLASDLLLMASALIAGKLFLKHFPSAPNWALTASLALWMAITGANMWIGGVSIVGYSVAEELPILVLPFAVPTAAVLLRWRFF